MIQMESKVQVADNTGARVAKMIGVIGTRSRHANVGDIVTAHIRESIPTANVKKGDVVRAVVVRTFAGVPGVEVPADGNDLIWKLTAFQFGHDVMRCCVGEFSTIHFQIKAHFSSLQGGR